MSWTNDGLKKGRKEEGRRMEGKEGRKKQTNIQNVCHSVTK